MSQKSFRTESNLQMHHRLQAKLAERRRESFGCLVGRRSSYWSALSVNYFLIKLMFRLEDISSGQGTIRSDD